MAPNDISKYFNFSISSLAQGIQKAEGWFVPQDNPQYPNGSKSYQFHNPGNLYGSPWEKYNVNGYSYFEDDIVGFFALCWQLLRYAQAKISGINSNSTLADALAVYTGLSGGAALDDYISTVESVSGIKRSVIMSNLIL